MSAGYRLLVSSSSSLGIDQLIAYFYLILSTFVYICLYLTLAPRLRVHEPSILKLGH
ncbi:hypothetical protein CPB83DRAFT_864691 [Crepidotus variabilis]|uniref:Uncharacterized protein n=1 Tax=Crepidotus variabilis TaxID=179855 RepID=A0A9P6E477_9AGAR|nr:hypothetical protein CPB83DRAFT_864691 [Crepidotus variabilis]